MPAYIAGQTKGVQPGILGFFIGAEASPATRKVITTVTRTTNVVTVTTSATHLFALGEIVEIRGVTGMTTASPNGLWAIATIPSGTTFTFAQTASDDALGVGGTAEAPTIEAVYASAAITQVIALPQGDNNAPQGRSIVWSHFYNVAPTAVTLSLEGAMSDGVTTGLWKQIDSDNTAAGNVKVVTGVQYRLIRLRVTALTIGSGAGQIAKLQLA